jgi:hypothetical protein
MDWLLLLLPDLLTKNWAKLFFANLLFCFLAGWLLQAYFQIDIWLYFVWSNIFIMFYGILSSLR